MIYWEDPIFDGEEENYVEAKDGECVGVRVELLANRIFDRVIRDGHIIEEERARQTRPCN